MKDDSWYNKIPGWIYYIGMISALLLISYCFPRLSLVIGYIWKYGLYVLFGGLALFLIIYYIFFNKD